jgi:hypothetical protein
MLGSGMGESLLEFDGPDYIRKWPIETIQLRKNP